MADVHNFIIPEQQYGGLYKLSDNLEMETQRKEAAATQRSAKKASLSSFLSNYINPKDYLTGTVHDPAIAQSINDILVKGAELAGQDGVDNNMLITALSPMVSKLGRTSENLKELERQRKESEGILKGKKGIDLNRFNDTFKAAAYYNPDGSLKDFSEIDATHNFADEALRNGDIYTPEGFDDFVAKSGKNTVFDKVKVTDSNKGSRMTQAKMVTPSFMMQEKDSNGVHVGFVPKFEIATDGENKLMHDFLGDKGEKINAPVRMITDDVFESLPIESKAYLRQEARRFANENNIPISSPQVHNFARALGYDELKKSGKQYSTIEEFKEEKAPTTKNITNISMGGNGREVPSVDMWGDIYNKVSGDDRVQRGAGYAATGLSGKQQNIILELLRDATGMNGKEKDNGLLTQKDFYLKADPEGHLYAIDAVTNKSIMPITAYDINTIANKDLNKTWSSPTEEKNANRLNLNTGGNVPTSRPQSNKATSKPKKDPLGLFN